MFVRRALVSNVGDGVPAIVNFLALPDDSDVALRKDYFGATPKPNTRDAYATKFATAAPLLLHGGLRVRAPSA